MAAAGSDPVLICGGGIMGCATAYYLAKRGIKSIILEATGIASGASGKAGGFLAREWCGGSPVHELATKSFDMHMGLSKEFMECGYRCLNTLAVTAKQGHKTKAKGDCPAWLENNVEEVSTLGTTENTAQVNPFKLCNTFFKRAQDMAGTEMRICEVTGFEKENKHIKGVKIQTGEVLAADRVVITLGPWCSKQFVKSLGISVQPHKAASVVMEDVNTSPHALFMSYTPATGRRKDDTDIEWYPRPDGTLYVCGEEEQTPLPDHTSQVQASDSAVHRIKSTIDAVCPGYSSKTSLQQACYLPATEDGVPVIGKVKDIEGLYVATGHGVWGILNSPATGAAMAELLVDNRCTLINLDNFSTSRLS